MAKPTLPELTLETRIDLGTKLQALAMVCLITIGDMHESGAHLRIVAARLRDSGSERNVDGYIKNTANTNTLLNKCLNSGRKGVTKADCQTALTMVRSSGTHTMLQAAASVAYNGDQWGNFIPTTYHGGAHLLPVVLPNCQGAREAVDIVMIVAAAEAFFPSAQPAAGITALFGAILMLALDKYC